VPPNIYDEASYKWVEVADDGDAYKIRHDYTILGHDISAGTCDMLVRWTGDGGHCIRHRHVAITTSLVISGEHQLIDLYEDGHSETRTKRAGDYGLSLGDAVPHLERGGAEGALVFFGNHAPNGVLYELIDADLKVTQEVTIQDLVGLWQAQ
jgi:hypothetical protein